MNHYPPIAVTRCHALRHLPLAENLREPGLLDYLLFHYFTKYATPAAARAALEAILIRDGERCITAANIYHVIKHHTSEIALAADWGGFWDC